MQLDFQQYLKNVEKLIDIRWSIRILHICEVRIEKYVRGSLCRVMPNIDPERPIFLSTPNNHDRLVFLLTF